MLKYIIITALLWFIVRINMGMDLQAYHQAMTGYLTGHQTALFVWTLAGGIVAYALTYLMDVLGLHSLMYLLARILLEASKFLVSLVFIGALFLYFDLGVNLWSELKFLMVLPFLLLGTALFCIRMFDFNFPIQDSFASSLAVPLFSAVVIFGSLWLNL